MTRSPRHHTEEEEEEEEEEEGHLGKTPPCKSYIFQLKFCQGYITGYLPCPPLPFYSYVMFSSIVNLKKKKYINPWHCSYFWVTSESIILH